MELPSPRQKPPHKPPSARSKVAWDDMLARLAAYKAQHGDCLVSRNIDKPLSIWQDTQRRAYKDGLILPDRKAKLDQLGFVWDSRTIKDQNWDAMYRQLQSYHAKFGTSDVVVTANATNAATAEDDKNNEGNYKALLSWTDKQRHFCQRPDRRAKLDALQFNWHRKPSSARGAKAKKLPSLGQDDEKWNVMFETLKEYKVGD